MPRIAELAVIGVPDDKWGETGLLAVVPRAGYIPTLADLRAFGADRFARFKLASALVILDSLPRSATGKIARSQIREE